MFSIYCATQHYDRFDRPYSTIAKVSTYAYETAALARRLAPLGYDEDGQETGETYFVADATDWRIRPVIPPSANFVEDEDIPF